MGAQEVKHTKGQFAFLLQKRKGKNGGNHFSQNNLEICIKVIRLHALWIFWDVSFKNV